MADGNVYLHPAQERAQLRRKMAAAVDQLLDAVDLIVRELDGGAADPDLEPSLGACEFDPSINMRGTFTRDVLSRVTGANDDREADGEREGAFEPLTDSDFEPSLGSLGGTARSHGAQAGWAGPLSGTSFWLDREVEHDGCEPTLGAPEPTTAGNMDQRQWAQGGDGSERELVSEDEGAPTGDDEPDHRELDAATWTVDA